MESSSPKLGRVWLALFVSLAVAAVGSGLAYYSISLVQATMDRQAKLAEENDFLKQNVEALKQGQEKLQDRILLEAETKRTAAIKLPLEPVEITSEALQDELEGVAASMQTQMPNLPEALHVIAIYKAQTRQYSDAQKLWQQCIKLAPKQELYYINLASIAMEQGNNDLALNTLRQGQTLGFDSYDMVHHLSLALSNEGEFEEVVQVVEASLKKFSGAAAQWLVLGQAQLELGQAEKAEASFRKAMELGADGPSVYVGLGNACIRAGKAQEGKEYLQKYVELKGRDSLTGAERYQVLSNQEIKRTATTVFTEAATVYFKQKDPFQTEKLLMRCVVLDPDSRSALRALADFYYQSKLLPEERVVRERIVDLGTEQFSDYLSLAKVCALLQDRSAAEAVLKMAMVRYPRSIDPYAALAQVYLEDGRLMHARWYAQQSIEQQPSAEGFRFLASICEKMKDANGAAEALEFAKKLEGKK